MEKVTVGVYSPSDDESLRKIAAVDGRINVEYLSPLIAAERKGDGDAGRRLDSLLAEVEVLYGWVQQTPRNLLARAPRLKWIQVMSAGVDQLSDDIRRSPVTVTNVSGIHGIAIGEFVLEIMLMFAKRAPLCFQLKQEKRFDRFFPDTLRGRTVGIIGLGHIGREVARLAKAFGMRVMATRRSAREGSRARYTDIVYPRDQLTDMLGQSDFVVLALPLTRETAGLIGERQLRAMKPGAYLVNVARGAVIDEGALIRALEENWIAGAGLDVFSTEPLPRDSRLWELPNVIMSPHVSGGMPDYMERTMEVFCENLKRYLTGKKLRHVVHKERGY